MLVKKKKMCYNKFKLREKEQGTIMWALGFVPLVIMYYIYHSQKVKKLENKIKRIEQWVKLRRVNKKGKEKFKLQRIEDIQTVEFDGK